MNRSFPATCGAVIPCFNEQKTIGELVSRLKESLPLVVVVNDGSTDETGLQARNAGAIVISHENNLGKGVALQTGLSYLLKHGFEWAITLDGDGQHNPADLPGLWQCAEKTGATLVIGNRMHNARAMPWLRRHVNRWMSKKLSQCAGRCLPDTQSGFRLVHLPTWACLNLSARHFEIESEMLMAFLAANCPVAFVPVPVIACARKSRIHPFKDTVRWWNWWRQMKKTSASRPAIQVSPPFAVKGIKKPASKRSTVAVIGRAG
jgi:glycosyltransferase involved in cell wall biosynthesis